MPILPMAKRETCLIEMKGEAGKMDKALEYLECQEMYTSHLL